MVIFVPPSTSSSMISSRESLVPAGNSLLLHVWTIRLGDSNSTFSPVMYPSQVVNLAPTSALAVAPPPVMFVCPSESSHASKIPRGVAGITLVTSNSSNIVLLLSRVFCI